MKEFESKRETQVLMCQNCMNEPIRRMVFLDYSYAYTYICMSCMVKIDFGSFSRIDSVDTQELFLLGFRPKMAWDIRS